MLPMPRISLEELSEPTFFSFLRSHKKSANKSQHSSQKAPSHTHRGGGGHTTAAAAVAAAASRAGDDEEEADADAASNEEVVSEEEQPLGPQSSTNQGTEEQRPSLGARAG